MTSSLLKATRRQILTIVEHSWVHDVAHNVDISKTCIGGPLFGQLRTSSVKVVGLQVCTRASLEALQLVVSFNGASLQDTSPKGFGEAKGWNTQETLEVFNDRLGEGQSFGLVDHFLFRQIVGNNELSQISSDLRGRSDLDNISEQAVGRGVGLLDLGPLSSQTKLIALDCREYKERCEKLFRAPGVCDDLQKLTEQVSVLAPWHFVFVNIT